MIVIAPRIIFHFVDGETEVQGGFTVALGHTASEQLSWHFGPCSVSPAFQEGGSKEERRGRWAAEGKGAPACGVWLWCLPKDENFCFHSLEIPQWDTNITNNGSALPHPPPVLTKTLVLPGCDSKILPQSRRLHMSELPSGSGE